VFLPNLRFFTSLLFWPRCTRPCTSHSLSDMNESKRLGPTATNSEN